MTGIEAIIKTRLARLTASLGPDLICNLYREHEKRAFRIDLRYNLPLSETFNFRFTIPEDITPEQAEYQVSVYTDQFKTAIKKHHAERIMPKHMYDIEGLSMEEEARLAEEVAKVREKFYDDLKKSVAKANESEPEPKPKPKPKLNYKKIEGYGTF
jgi:hypothetical protein